MGNELAKAGFAVRKLRSVYGSDAKLLGYVEFGKELGQFVHAMKDQTGNDFGLLFSIQYVDRQFWVSFPFVALIPAKNYSKGKSL